MNRQELIAKLNSIRDVAPLGSVVKKAAELLEDVADIKVVVREWSFPVEHFQEIGQRRLLHCRDLGIPIVGLEETMQSLASTSGELFFGCAEVGGLVVQFFLDKGGTIKGCIIIKS